MDDNTPKREMTLRELGARAICEAQGLDPDCHEGGLDMRARWEVRASQSQAVLDAIGHAALVDALKEVLRFLDNGTDYELTHPQDYGAYETARAALKLAQHGSG